MYEIWHMGQEKTLLSLCVMGTVAHHKKLEEIYKLGTIQTQEQG